MNLRWYNRNAVNTHFGGSLYSMVDPHLMLMLMQLLGNEYIVWDKSAQIDFLRPGKGKVQAVLTISDKEIDTIIAETKRHAKTMPRFEVQVVDESGQVVALVGKTLYVRRKKQRS